MWTWRWFTGENVIQISISFNKLTNVSIFLRIYLVKKPFALIVCLALLMNPYILQLLLIEIWSAKFFVKILQVHNVLATIHTMQFYFRWFYWKSVWHQLYYSFVMFQEGEQYIFLFRLIFSCMALFKILHSSDFCYKVVWYTPLQNVWHGSKSVVTFGLIKILSHPC